MHNSVFMRGDLMKDYLKLRYKSYLRMLIAMGIGYLAAVIFSDSNGNYYILSWIVGALIIVEITNYLSWFLNKKKKEKK